MPIADVPTLSSVSDKIQFLKRKTEVYLDRLRFIVSEVIVDKIGVVNYIDLDVRLHLIDKIKKNAYGRQDSLEALDFNEIGSQR